MASIIPAPDLLTTLALEALDQPVIHSQRAADALDEARDGLGGSADEVATATLYGLITAGEVRLAVHQALNDILNQLADPTPDEH